MLKHSSGHPPLSAAHNLDCLLAARQIVNLNHEVSCGPPLKTKKRLGLDAWEVGSLRQRWVWWGAIKSSDDSMLPERVGHGSMHRVVKPLRRRSPRMSLWHCSGIRQIAAVDDRATPTGTAH